MAVDNEIVRFIAKIDLDPETAKGFEQQLERSDKYCESLRQEIDRTKQAMIEMKANSESNTEAYKKQEQHLASLQKTYKEAQTQTQKYSQALGVNKMSMQELRAYTKQLRQALDSMHKEADPATWEKYSKELKAAENRMRELRGGVQKTGGVFKSLKDKVVPSLTAASLAVKGIEAALGLARKAFNDMKTETQQWGDAWTANMAGLNAGWHQFIANMAAGSGTLRGSIMDAVKVAKEVAGLKDELFEMGNSYEIAKTKAQEYLNEQQAIAMDSSKSAEERWQALDNIKTKQLELAATEADIAAQEKRIALETIEQRTGLHEDELKIAIDAYNENREAFKLAKDYNDLLVKRENLIRTADTRNSWSMQWTAQQVDELDKKMAEASDTVVQYAYILRQYNLGNDAMVKSYVDATNHAQAVANRQSEIDADQARRRGTLQKQLDAEAKAAREKSYNDRIKAAERTYKQELLLLKEQLSRREITETEFNAKSQSAELAMLNAKIAINKAYGKDIIDLQTQIADKRLAAERKIQDALKKSDEEFYKEMERQGKEMEESITKMLDDMTAEIEAEIEAALEDDDPIKHLAELMDRHKDDEMQSRSGKITAAQITFDAEMSDLEELHDLQLISEEEYLARKKNLHSEFAKNIAQINLESWQNSMEIAGQFLDQASQMVGALREAEETRLDAQMQAELAAAGDNAEERERIEAEYEQKKLDTQKKYADVDMAINIAKTIAAGALAVMQAYAQLPAPAAAVMAGVMAVTTAAEVATIVAQRNAIKNASASSSSVSASGAAGDVGFSEGGYTGPGGRLEPAGVVHRGEYVVAAPELRDPYVARQVAGIERMRLARTGGAKSRFPGYADGGYTSPASGSQAPDDNGILEDIYDVLSSIAATPIPAYVVLSDLETKYDERDRFKTVTSLKRKKK